MLTASFVFFFFAIFIIGNVGEMSSYNRRQPLCGHLGVLTNSIFIFLSQIIIIIFAFDEFLTLNFSSLIFCSRCASSWWNNFVNKLTSKISAPEKVKKFATSFASHQTFVGETFADVERTSFFHCSLIYQQHFYITECTSIKRKKMKTRKMSRLKWAVY